MKKILSILALSMVYAGAFSQDSVSVKPAIVKPSTTGVKTSINTTNFKPTTKSFTVEVNLDPFSSSPVSISYLRFRTFLSENGALRLGVSVGAKTENPTEDLENKTFELNLRPGYEWHFAGTERLSPYIGAELDYAMKSSKAESTLDGNEYEVEGAWSDNGTERGYTRIGMNVICGVDIYIIKRLYLGTEIGFGFENVKYEDIKYKAGTFTDTISEGGSSFQIGPNFNSSIRLGFVF